MKKLVCTVFIAFWASIATLLIVNALAPAPTTNDERTAPEPDEPASYSLAEVAQHDTLEDCWMAIEGGVYDFSDYVPRHPAPPSVLEPWCGREATEGMRTKGDGSDHSARAWRMAERFRIGNLHQSGRSE